VSMRDQLHFNSSVPVAVEASCRVFSRFTLLLMKIGNSGPNQSQVGGGKR